MQRNICAFFIFIKTSNSKFNWQLIQSVDSALPWQWCVFRWPNFNPQTSHRSNELAYCSSS